MTPTQRLRAAQVVTVAGAAIALIGVVVEWFSVAREGRTIDVPDFGTVPFPEQVESVSGLDLGVALPTFALILGLAAGLGVLARARGRRVALGLVVFGAVGLVVTALLTGAADAIAAAPPPAGGGVGPPTASLGAGKIVTIVGAVVALGGAGWGLPVASSAADVRMPERGPTGA